MIYTPFSTFILGFYFRLIHWVAAQLRATLAFLLLAATLMLPFPIALANHYRHFSQVQRYWFMTFVRTELSPWGERSYRVLVVEDSSGHDQLASDKNVLPGHTRTAEDDDVPFVLSTTAQKEGKKLVLLSYQVLNNADFAGALRNEIYDGQSIFDVGIWGFLTGFFLVMAFSMIFLAEIAVSYGIRMLDFIARIYRVIKKRRLPPASDTPIESAEN